MTREEAGALQVGKSKVFVVEPKLEEVFEIIVVKIELGTYSKPDSALSITGRYNDMMTREYLPSELHATKIKALEHLASLHQLKSDQALDKKHRVYDTLAKLKKKRNRNG